MQNLDLEFKFWNFQFFSVILEKKEISSKPEILTVYVPVVSMIIIFTANLDTIINNVNHLSNFLNSGKTWINIKDMYLHTCLHTSVLISFILTIWWDGVSFFKIQNKLQVTQNHLDFCTKCKQTFRVIDETLEFDCLSNKRRWRSNSYSRLW